MSKKNIQYLDTLRALATFGVIVIHVATPALKMNFGKNAEYWMIANVVDSAVRSMVPIFLMLTGATLLGRSYESVTDFYKKRYQRLLLPFVFWMLLYWAYFWWKLPIHKQPHELTDILSWALKLWFDVGISKHFWYFFMIAAVYLVIPFMGRFVQSVSRRTLLYTLLGWAVFCFLTRDVPVNMYSWSPAMLPTKLLGWVQHSGYILLGYYLFTLPEFHSSKRVLWLSVYGLSIASCAAFTWYFTSKSGKLDLAVYGYIKPNTMLQSIAFFLMCKDMMFVNKPILWVQSQVCRNSYGIYLGHVMALSFLFDHKIYWNIGNPVWSIFVVSLVALLLGYGFVLLLRRMPWGTHIAG